MIVKWNLTNKAKLMGKSDVLLLSISKSGRTWLRVMINKYISLIYDIPFSLENLSKRNNEVSSIFYTHGKWAHYEEATLSQKIIGRYIVPAKILSAKKVIMLFRDPRDVIVSLYFHVTKRGRKPGKEKHSGNVKLMDFVVGPRSRMPRMINVLNDWRRSLENHPDCLWISYEDLKADTKKIFFQVLEHIGFDTINEDFAVKAIEFAGFENMKKMEAEGRFKKNLLRPGDPSDPDSYKVRKGVVGGYMEYFNEDELPILDKSIDDLDPFYGYTKASD
jgi:hypothetical protein